MRLTDQIDKASIRDDIPDFSPGDTVKVHVRVVEGNRQRIQIFEGAVIGRQGGGVSETFTVRKISFGVGVERTFPVHSPIVDKIEKVSRGRVRRAKLYYQRERIGKRAKIKEKRDWTNQPVVYLLDSPSNPYANVGEDQELSVVLRQHGPSGRGYLYCTPDRYMISALDTVG